MCRTRTVRADTHPSFRRRHYRCQTYQPKYVKFNTELEATTLNLVKFLETTTGMRVGRIACDYVVDDDGTVWLLQASEIYVRPSTPTGVSTTASQAASAGIFRCVVDLLVGCLLAGG